MHSAVFSSVALISVPPFFSSTHAFRSANDSYSSAGFAVVGESECQVLECGAITITYVEDALLLGLRIH
jgi:hypothetical protein